MINEDVGLIYGFISASDYNFCERVLLTTDGGIHWFYITAALIDELAYAEVTDFTLVDGIYTLEIKYDYGYASYQSSDLKTWIRIN